MLDRSEEKSFAMKRRPNPIRVAAFIQAGRQYWEARDRFGLSIEQVYRICNRFGVVPSYSARATTEDIVTVASRVAKCSVNEILGQHRPPRAVLGRALVVDGCRRYRPMMSWPEIAAVLCREFHSTCWTSAHWFQDHPNRETLRQEMDELLVINARRSLKWSIR